MGRASRLKFLRKQDHMFGNGNGNKGQKPIVLPGGQHVPIIGQPFDIKGFQVTVALVCKCDGAHTILVTSSGLSQCPACKKAYSVAGLQYQAGKPPHFNMAIAMPNALKSAEPLPADAEKE